MMRISSGRKLASTGSFAAIMLIIITIVAALATVAPTQAATWTQVWNDEFSGAANTAVNGSNWLYDTGTGYPGSAGQWGTGEVESMSSSTANVYQDGAGHLAIKPIRDGNGNWTSGRIETQRTDFAAPAGGELAVEASIQQPNVSGAAAAGYWPAFWMLGQGFRGNYNNWPGIGEIDILEDVNGLSSVFGTLHCGTNPGGPCNETTGIGSGQHSAGGLQTAYHTYRMEYDRSVSPEQIRWYLDGVNYFTVNANQVDATTWNNAVHHGFFVIFDVAMGGGFPAAFGAGAPTSSTTSGVPMLVDYVRVYTSGGATPTATPQPGNTPTPTPKPAPTATPSGSADHGATSTGSSTAQLWYKVSGAAASYVIVHYTITGQGQQNVYTTYNSSTGHWEYNISGISAGQSVSYFFTYNQGGLQYDTATYSWTHP